jgi:polyhydroxyalkanoate synthesis regulator phasin
MEHPFINKKELESKTMEELQEVISKLTTKLTFAYRTQNGPLMHQIQMAMETYKNQHSKKMDELFEKQNLKSKINIQSDNEHKN